MSLSFFVSAALTLSIVGGETTGWFSWRGASAKDIDGVKHQSSPAPRAIKQKKEVVHNRAMVNASAILNQDGEDHIDVTFREEVQLHLSYCKPDDDDTGEFPGIAWIDD